MSFDSAKFKSLDGLELGQYTMCLLQEGITEAQFLPYFTSNASTMDMAHLEYAVGILGKIGSDAAYQKVAEYLEHPCFSVQFVATKTIAAISAADETVMRMVVESLSKHEGDPNALAQELRDVLHRPANDEARHIASGYQPKSKASLPQVPASPGDSSSLTISPTLLSWTIIPLSLAFLLASAVYGSNYYQGTLDRIRAFWLAMFCVGGPVTFALAAMLVVIRRCDRSTVERVDLFALGLAGLGTLVFVGLIIAQRWR